MIVQTFHSVLVVHMYIHTQVCGCVGVCGKGRKSVDRGCIYVGRLLNDDGESDDEDDEDGHRRCSWKNARPRPERIIKRAQITSKAAVDSRKLIELAAMDRLPYKFALDIDLFRDK